MAKSSTDLYVACDDNFSFHLLNIFTLCIAGSLGHALSMSSTSTGVSCRLVARWVCHSEKHSVSWTRWASAQTTSRRRAWNLDSCSSRLTPRIIDTPPSAIARILRAWKIVRIVSHLASLKSPTRYAPFFTKLPCQQKWDWISQECSKCSYNKECPLMNSLLAIGTLIIIIIIIIQSYSLQTIAKLSAWPTMKLCFIFLKTPGAW